MAEATVTGHGLPGREDLPRAPAMVHLMGAAGAGMRGLAVLLRAAGYRVSGCDASLPPDADELRTLVDPLREGHAASHLEGADLLVYSAAVPPEAPELRAADAAGIPALKRARAVGALLNASRLVGVSGTHGKTTITAMTGWAATAAGLDPTVLVGGRVDAWGGYARGGSSGLAVAEADEYDRSFLELDPDLAVVSSLEPEHLEVYGDMDELRAAFAEFAGRASGRDGALFCADQPGAREVGEGLPGALSYGFSETAAYRVERVSRGPGGQRCRLSAPTATFEFALGVSGEHNAQNAAAALASVLRLGADPGELGDALGDFHGVERRLQTLTDRDGFAVVDDYAHHPSEVQASLSALRQSYGDRRIVLVFQPHLYSRTRDFARGFAKALGRADEALVLPIFPSRERPIPGVTSELITAAGEPGVSAATAEETLERVRRARREGERVAFVFMGAGDVTELAGRAARLVENGRAAGASR